MKICPHCGAQLPEEASFCPRCAKSVNVRTAPKPPRPFPRKLLCRAIAVALLAAVALGVWRYTQPKTYEGVGEVIYTDADGTYQLVLKRGSGRYEPVTQAVETPEEGIDCRSTMRLYINHRDSGADASGVFLQKVDFVTAEFIQDEDGPSPWTCTQPAPNASILEAALVTLNDFTAESGDTEQVWTLHMKNGDTIVLRMPIHLEPIPAYHYYPEDAPMDTIEDLQALVDQVSRTAEEDAVVYLHLPAVTYTGNLAITERPINLYGNTEGAGRTTFTGNVQVTYAGTAMSYFDQVDFAGDGAGVGLSVSDRVHLTNCTFAGWKTGVLAYGDGTWVTVQNCRFEDNTTGFHFNAATGVKSYNTYTDSTFVNNGTAVLLEQVPGDSTLVFDGSLFQGNGTDIDNRCGQSVDISKAVFQ